MRDAQIIYLHPAKHAAEFHPTPGMHIVSAYEFLPAGMPGMLNLLRANGFSVIGMNPFLEGLLNPRFDLRAALAVLTQPKLFAIDMHWYEHAHGAIDMARLCKQAHPAVPVVLGGFTASLFTDEILARHPEVDYAIRGDGEVPLLRLVQHLVRAQGEINEVPNLVYRRGEEIVHTHKAVQSLEAMARQWDTFCAQHGGNCFGVPRGW